MSKATERGQAVIVLLMIMLVTLTVGLAITQRSLSDLSTSNKVEESSRAFNAAEAGIESVTSQLNPPANSNLNFSDNQSNATVSVASNLPQDHQALEYPPITKADFAHIWLANPTDLSNPYPANRNLIIYFGNYSPSQALDDPDTPAIEVSLLTVSGVGNYTNSRSYFDPLISRVSTNNFTQANCSAPPYSPDNGTSSGRNRDFRCMVSINTPQASVLMRIRILYSNSAQVVAVAPEPTLSLPKQASILTSVGSAGGSQQKIQVFKLMNVVPPFFDYSIFSVGDLIKPSS